MTPPEPEPDPAPGTDPEFDFGAEPEARPRAAAAPKHTLSLYVRDKPGVVVRVSLVFARRGYNIDSLVASPTSQRGFSRITISCSGDAETFEQIIKQLGKLVDVVHAIDHTGDSAYAAELALVKLDCPTERRTRTLRLLEAHGAQVVDYSGDCMIARVQGSSEALDALVALLQPLGLRELVRSGKILLALGRSIT